MLEMIQLIAKSKAFHSTISKTIVSIQEVISPYSLHEISLSNTPWIHKLIYYHYFYFFSLKNLVIFLLIFLLHFRLLIDPWKATYLSKQYIQPQWIYENVNEQLILSTKSYTIGRYHFVFMILVILLIVLWRILLSLCSLSIASLGWRCHWFGLDPWFFWLEVDDF